MPEIRRDPVAGRWIIIASERAKRVQDLKHRTQAVASSTSSSSCPFCEGREDATTPEIAAVSDHGRTPNTAGWRVRVVPNKYPVLQVEGMLEPRGDGMYDYMNGVGAHEVIIESGAHKVSLTELEGGLVREIVWMYRDRLVDLKRDRRLVHGLIFKNVGPSAGATVEHAHSQLVCTPVVPKAIAEEMARAAEYLRFRGRCLFCDMVRQELQQYVRVVAETTGYVVFAPFAARFPFETWILPKRHRAHFEDTPRAELDELADVLKSTLAKIERALDRPAYNYLIHTAPFDPDGEDSYHWHVEILPRLTEVAGFEWGADFYVNPVPPESSAEFLRSVEVA